MKVHSYTIVHYGADYLSYALRSVYDAVDRLHVVYTPHPSHGHATDQLPPDNRGSLIGAAFRHDPEGKVQWYDSQGVTTEGPQRNRAVEICQRAGANMILVVDCDEVWPAKTLRAALDHAWQADSARDWLINFTHLWRSFNWQCNDDLWPVRIIDLRHGDGVGYTPKDFGKIYHFGYAVRDKVMRYKWQIHGHKNELRPGWFEDKWDAWPPVGDCHPTNEKDWWTPEPFDKAELPALMLAHPFYNLDRID